MNFAAKSSELPPRLVRFVESIERHYPYYSYSVSVAPRNGACVHMFHQSVLSAYDAAYMANPSQYHNVLDGEHVGGFVIDGEGIFQSASGICNKKYFKDFVKSITGELSNEND